MGVRFRKSIKITKGAKINLSKSGASLSLGGRGHSVTFGNRGTRTTVGIPGTGLSYSHFSSKKKHDRSRESVTRSVQNEEPVSHSVAVRFRMDENGHSWFEYDDGEKIYDRAVIKQITSTPAFQEQMAAAIQEQNAEYDNLINIHKLSESVRSESDFSDELDRLSREEYKIQPFSIPEPTEDDIRFELEDEAAENIHSIIFESKKRKQYVEDNLMQRYEERLLEWDDLKTEYYDSEEKTKREIDDLISERVAELPGLINGDEQAISKQFDALIMNLELPVEINIDYEWEEANGLMKIDLDLPEIEDIPNVNYIGTSDGLVKTKKKTQGELKAGYAQLVFGIAVYLCSAVFNVSPAIKKILISAYTQRRDKNGDENDVYVYSLKFPREMFGNIDYYNLLPREFCMQTENRINMTSTLLLKEIKPFDKY